MNRKFMAIAERRECKDWVSIYYTGNEWKLVNTFEVETLDLVDLQWIKEDTAILLWDSPLECKILVYSAMTGELIAKHCPHTLGLGVKSVSSSPNSSYIIAAFFDPKIRVYNAIS
jgi:WD40 repeat protein